ncbi:MAG: glycosyltransferase [Rhodanobacteraceae bacterium]|nr:glycosyltransferase [Rhodanobacteraceae bacterium]
MVCLEALTYGVPFWWHRTAAVRGDSRDGRFGLLVRNRDPGDAAEAMLKLATNPAWAEDMGRRGAAHARESFNMIVSSRKLANLYDEVMRS